MGYSTAQYTVCNSAFLGAIGCGTTALANNDLGDVVGTYTDAGIAQHGFLRYPNGSITSFDAPGAGSGPGQGTVAFAINNAGVVAGRVPGRQWRVPRVPALPERLLCDHR